MKKHTLLLALVLTGQGFAHAVARAVSDTLGVVGRTEYTSLHSIFSYSSYGYLILAILLFGVLFAALRGRDLFLRERVNAFNLFKAVHGYLKNNQLKEAASVAEAVGSTALGRVYSHLLGCCLEEHQRDLPQGQLPGRLQQELRVWELEYLPQLAVNLGWLSTLAWTSLLIGVMGAAFGLINAAAAFSQADLDLSLHTQFYIDNPLTIFVDLIGRFRYALGDIVLGCAAAAALLLMHRALLSRAERITNEARLYAQKLVNLL